MNGRHKGRWQQCGYCGRFENHHRDNGAFTANRQTQDRHEPRHRADVEAVTEGGGS